MKLIDITDDLIGVLIREMAPMVANLTEWELAISGVGARSVRKEDAYEEILVARLEELCPGLDLGGTNRGLLERFVEYLVEANVKGAYLPGTEEIVLVRENVDESNMDGLRILVAHELVHRGQHVNHPELFKKLEDEVRRLMARTQHGKASFGDMRGTMERVNSVMRIVEGHATYVQQVLHQTRFPDAQIEMHFDMGWLLMRLFGRQKVDQYRRGLAEVVTSIQEGKTVESLYRETT